MEASPDAHESRHALKMSVALPLRYLKRRPQIEARVNR